MSANSNSDELSKMLTCRIFNKYFIDPVVLPCCSTICKEHVVLVNIGNDMFSFNCQVCNQEHKTLEENFPKNSEVVNFLKFNFHLDEQTAKEMKLIEEFENVLRELSLVCKDPNNEIFKHISAIRNKIDFK